MPNPSNENWLRAARKKKMEKRLTAGRNVRRRQTIWYKIGQMPWPAGIEVLVTFLWTSESTSGREKILRFHCGGGAQGRPRTDTSLKHVLLTVAAWRMYATQEKPNVESSCNERNKCRKSLSLIRVCSSELFLIDRR